MQHKGLNKHLCYGSTAEKDKICTYEAFSLAEMLCVLLIMSFIAIGLPAIHFKKTELKTKRSLHGRYECYYEGNQLTQYTVNEDGAATGPTAVSQCKFKPPKNAIFFMVHAVGGGGGASSGVSGGGTASCTPKTVAESYNRNQANDFPQWLKDVQGAGQLPPPTVDDKYNTEVTGCVAEIKYGNGGKAGETISMFFPRLNNVEIVMNPGRGGALGGAGAQTTVKIGDAEMKAAGGSGGGSGSSTETLWFDSTDSICKVTDNGSREPDASDFGTNIEMDFGTKMISKMASACAGGGGAGGFSSTNGTLTKYTVNGVDVTAYVKKTACQAKIACATGENDTGAAQSGRNGAVVILW